VNASSEEAHQDGVAASAFKGKKKRGPPENGIPSSTKIMVANLPYELSEDKVRFTISIGCSGPSTADIRTA